MAQLEARNTEEHALLQELRMNSLGLHAPTEAARDGMSDACTLPV